MSFTKAEFEAVKIGSTVGCVTGPGQSPKSCTATVREKVETRWGYHLVCEYDAGAYMPGADIKIGGVATCSGFTKVGIGWYLLAEPK